MSVKIRLQRRGRTHYSRFSIVVADSRAPRDGRIIEKLGTYNPNVNPANINLEFDRAIHWLQVGAIPTDTCRSILSHEGVMYKNHLINGVKKGALTEEQVEERYNTWKKEKEAKIDNVVTNLEKDAKNKANKLFEAEKLINEERAAEIAKKNSVLLEQESEEKTDEDEKVEENKEEKKNEKVEEKKEEKKDEKVEEKKEEKKDEKVEEKKEEKKDEKVEEKKEEKKDEKVEEKKDDKKE